MAKDGDKRTIVPVKVPSKLLKEFPEPKSSFHEKWAGVRFIGGRTLSRIGKYHKAAILVQTANGLQIRFYGWMLTKKDKWWAQQRFYVSHGSVSRIFEVLDAFNLAYQQTKTNNKEES